MAATEKKTRTALTLEQRKAKLAKDKAKFEKEHAQIAILELKDYISALKIANVGSLFSVVKANKPNVDAVDVLRTLADIAKLKVVITEKPRTARKPKVSAAAK